MSKTVVFVSLPVIEAMYYQKPLFLSSHTCLPEIGDKYAYCFNYEFDEDLMRKEFIAGMEDFERGGINKEEMKERALGFSWDKAASEYCNIYKEMML